MGEPADGRRHERGRPRRVHEDVPHRPLRRGGARLHAEGPGEDAAGRLHADRLRLRRAHRRRPPHGRREGERTDRAAPLPAAERRPRRDPHLEAGARAVARLAGAREELARPQQDPPVVHARDARGSGGEGPRVARAGAQAAEPAVREAPPLGGARAGDPRDSASRRPRTSTSRSGRDGCSRDRSSTRSSSA